jgi:hypothetical protein
MAMIIELRDRRGAASWHRLDGSRLVIGRALSNEIILDDPYADARHAVIERADDGTFTVSDLGSVNGTFANDDRIAAPMVLTPGVELRVGRTSLRLRDENEPLPPAVAETAQRLPRGTTWALSERGGLAMMAVLTAVGAYLGWASSTDRSSTSDTIGGGIAALMFALIWAGIWGLVTRGPDRRFRFRAHLLVVSAAFLVGTLVTIASEWVGFYLPGAWIFDLLFGLVLLILLGGVVTAHLTVGAAMTPRGRLYAGIGVCAALMAFMLLGRFTSDEKFSDVPSFSSRLKPVPGGRVPAMSIDEFVAAMEEEKTKADEALEK